MGICIEGDGEPSAPPPPGRGGHWAPGSWSQRSVVSDASSPRHPGSPGRAPSTLLLGQLTPTACTPHLHLTHLCTGQGSGPTHTGSLGPGSQARGCPSHGFRSHISTRQATAALPPPPRPPHVAMEVGARLGAPWWASGSLGTSQGHGPASAAQPRLSCRAPLGRLERSAWPFKRSCPDQPRAGCGLGPCLGHSRLTGHPPAPVHVLGCDGRASVVTSRTLQRHRVPPGRAPGAQAPLGILGNQRGGPLVSKRLGLRSERGLCPMTHRALRSCGLGGLPGPSSPVPWGSGITHVTPGLGWGDPHGF